jgi:hypothetical protein
MWTGIMLKKFKTTRLSNNPAEKNCQQLKVNDMKGRVMTTSELTSLKYSLLRAG